MRGLDLDLRRALLGLAALALSCGGQKGTLTVSIATSPASDPFATATQVKVQLGDPAVAQSNATVSGGHFSASFDFAPPSGSVITAAILVQAFDGSGAVVGRGHSPLLGVVPANALVTVWVGRPGSFAATGTPLGKARLLPAVTAIPRLGPLVVGGSSRLDGGGPAFADSEVYDLYAQRLVETAALPSPRTGAVAIGYERTDQATGAAMVAAGLETSGELLQFEPLSGTGGAWAVLASDDSLKRSFPTATPLADGTTLLSGGTRSGADLNSATLITPPPHLAITPVTATMAADRANHTATPIKGPMGDAVLLFGGSRVGGPAAELFLVATRGFVAQDLGGAKSRHGHTATALSDGRVVIAGGHSSDDAMASPLASGIVVAPTTLAAEARDTLLPTARRSHAAALVGDRLLLCGGYGSDGKALATCDVLDAASLAPRPSIALATARADATLLLLATGDLLLVGGENEAGPVTTVEIFTP